MSCIRDESMGCIRDGLIKIGCVSESSVGSIPSLCIHVVRLVNPYKASTFLFSNKNGST